MDAIKIRAMRILQQSCRHRWMLISPEYSKYPAVIMCKLCCLSKVESQGGK